MSNNFPLRWSDLFAFAVLVAAIPFGLVAAFIWFEQAIAYSDSLGIASAAKSNAIFQCRADVAFQIGAVIFGITFLFRLLHLCFIKSVGWMWRVLRLLLEPFLALVLALYLVSIYGLNDPIRSVVQDEVNKWCPTPQ